MLINNNRGRRAISALFLAVIIVVAAIGAGIFVYLALTSSSSSSQGEFQSASAGTSGCASTCQLQFSNSVTAGDVVVVAFGWCAGGTSVSGVSDWLHTSYHYLIGSDHNDGAEIYAGVLTSSGPDTVSISTSGSNAGCMGAEAFEVPKVTLLGNLTSSQYGSGSSMGVQSFTPSTGSFVAAIASDYCSSSGSQSFTAGSGFTLGTPQQPIGGGISYYIVPEYSVSWGSSSTNAAISSNCASLSWDEVAISLPPAISLSISASATSGNAPLSVSFSSAVTGGTPPYSYSWTFGNSKTSQSPSPSTTYSSPGNYLVQLTITDSAGAQASASLTVSVTSATTTTTTTVTTTNSTNSSSSTATTTTQSVVPILSLLGEENNVTVDSAQIKPALSLSGNLSISNVQSSTTIKYFLYNATAIEFVFASPGPVSLSLDATHAPLSVWANSNPISSWVYNNGTLSISSTQASNIAIFFPSQQQPITSPNSSLVQFFQANWVLLLIIIMLAGAAFGAAARRRR